MMGVDGWGIMGWMDGDNGMEGWGIMGMDGHGMLGMERRDNGMEGWDNGDRREGITGIG